MHALRFAFLAWRSIICWNLSSKGIVIAADDKTVKVTIALPTDVLDRLQKLAASEGVSANTKLVESLMRDLYLADKQSKGASILIQEQDKSFQKVS